MANGALVGRGYVERANVITGAALTANGQTTFSREFPMGEGWYKAWLRFNFGVTIGTGAGPVTEGELLAIKNVLLRTDRGEMLCNLPGRALYKIATYREGTPPRKDAIAAATATYRVGIPIYFADFAMDFPNDTILDTARYNSVSLQLTMGGLADLLGAPGTATLAITFDMEIERSYGKLPAPAQPKFHISYDFRPPVDASVTQNIDVERSSDMSVKRLYVHSGTTGTGGVPFSGANADTIQNVILLKDQNRFIEKDRIHGFIQDMNKLDAGLEVTIVGLEVYDFVRERSIAGALATGDKSVLQYSWTNQGGVGANSIVTLAAEMIRTLK
jgi:hypothetical protein